jgi:integrase
MMWAMIRKAVWKAFRTLPIASRGPSGKASPKFFTWLAKQPGFRSRISYADPKYFNLSNRDKRIAAQRPLKPTPTPEQVRHVILSTPSGTDIELRNRALIALLLLTGIRVTAAITLKLTRAD